MTETEKLLIETYEDLKSSYKVAKKLGISASKVKRQLKKLGKLRTQSQAAKERDNSHLDYKRTEAHKKNLSELAKKRRGSSNPFYGKKHTKEVKDKLSKLASSRVGEKNPNWKDGISFDKKRERDLKKKGFRKVANACKNRDKYICQACNEKKDGHLHAHHILPYWICEDAFYDLDNLITLCSDCHKEVGHLGDWRSFNIDLVTDNLLQKYSFHRERLSGLAIYSERVK